MAFFTWSDHSDTFFSWNDFFLATDPTVTIFRSDLSSKVSRSVSGLDQCCGHLFAGENWHQCREGGTDLCWSGCTARATGVPRERDEHFREEFADHRTISDAEEQFVPSAQRQIGAAWNVDL